MSVCCRLNEMRDIKATHVDGTHMDANSFSLVFDDDELWAFGILESKAKGFRIANVQLIEKCYRLLRRGYVLYFRFQASTFPRAIVCILNSAFYVNIFDPKSQYITWESIYSWRELICENRDVNMKMI